MQKIVKEFITHSLSGEDIITICNGEANLLTNSEICKMSSIDDVLGQHEACVILYDRKNGEAGHWSCIFRISDNFLEFFCPYGIKPDEACEFTGAKSHLIDLVNKGGYKIMYNDKQLQKYKDDVNVCGRYVGLRIALRDMPLKDFIDLFTKNKCYTPDFWVTVLTLFCEK
jgi:hypothetical protein